MTDGMTLRAAKRDSATMPSQNHAPKPVSGDIRHGETDRLDIRASLMRKVDDQNPTTSRQVVMVSTDNFAQTSQAAPFTATGGHIATVISRRAEDQSLLSILHEHEAQIIKRQTLLDEAVTELSSDSAAAHGPHDDANEEEIPWYKRALSMTRDGVKGAIKLNEDLGKWLVDKVVAGAKAAAGFVEEVVTDPAKAVKKVKAAAERVIDTVRAASQAVIETLESGAVWVQKNGVQIAHSVLDIFISPFKAGWEVMKGFARGSMDVAAALLGQKSWSEVGQNFMGSMCRAGEMLRPGYEISCAVLKMAWNVVKGVSDSLGITQLLGGAYHLVALVPHLLWDSAKLLTGQGSFTDLRNNVATHLKGCVEGVIGAVTCFVEVTGIADLYHALYQGCLALVAYGRGDEAAFKQHAMMMAMHGAFALMSIGSIVATIGTAGAAGGSIVAVAAGRATLKQAGKVFLKEAGEQFFKTGAKEIGEKVTREVLEAAPRVLATRPGGAALLKELEVQAAITGRAVAELAYKELLRVEAQAAAKETAKRMAKNGLEGATLDGAKKIAREVGEIRTKGFLKELGLDLLVENETYAFLRNGVGKDVKSLSKEIAQKFDLSAKKARSMAKEVQDALKSGRSDARIRRILEDGISEPLIESLQEGMEVEYKRTMSKALRGDLKELGEAEAKQLREAVEANARRSGKEVGAYQDELVDSSWSGYKEGIERGVRSVVREGIERAFKRFRERKNRLHSGAGPIGSRQAGRGEALESPIEESETAFIRRPAGHDEGFKGHDNLFRQRLVTGPQGELIHITEAFDSNKNQWTVVNTEVERGNAA